MIYCFFRKLSENNRSRYTTWVSGDRDLRHITKGLYDMSKEDRTMFVTIGSLLILGGTFFCALPLYVLYRIVELLVAP